MIVDAHCHAGRGEGLTGPWDTRAHLDRYLHRARRAGIDRSVVFSVFHTDYVAANAAVARLVARHPCRLIGFACVHPRRDAGRVGAMVRRAVTAWRFRGIKVHRLDAAITREVCDAERRRRIHVLYDVVGLPHLAEMAAREYPDVDFVLPHLGSFSDRWSAHLQVIDMCARLPNVYADTSGVRGFDVVVEAVRRAGPRKIIFGSDGPQLHPALELQKIRLLRLSAADERQILGGTILRLLRRARIPGAGILEGAGLGPPGAGLVA